jgi:glycosyltransferase involved in cell wall biosynthesis
MQDFHEQEMPSAYDRKVFQTTLRLPMYFLTNSEFTKEVVLEVQPNAKVKVVGAGVNLEVFYPRKKRVIDSHGVPIVAVIVRKEPIKQASLAIEVLNQVNKVVPIHAILIGKIPQNVRIDFHFSSYTRITDNELAELYSASDLFLFTSSVEGFALPPLEAMACGTPVVTTDCKGNRDYATDGFNCLISPQKDKEQLVSQTVNVLKKRETPRTSNRRRP